MSSTSASRIGRKRITLECRAEPGHDVFVAGTFNDWNPHRKSMRAVDNDGGYRAVLMLAPGDYEYKFVVDGTWRVDGDNPRWAPNAFGSLNSVVSV